jgi:hypothetical protein
VSVTFVEVVPALLVALTVYSVADDVTAGVPEITQVVGLIESPDKSVGDIAQFVIVAPWSLSAVGVTVIAVPTEPVVPVASS